MKKAVILIITLLLCGNAPADEAKHVMVIHSFHQGMVWTDHITQGIQSVFDPFRQEIQVHFEYLDSLHAAGDEYFQEMARLLALKRADTAFDAIIAVGDDALQFARRYEIKPASGNPLVFCGTNHSLSHYPQNPEVGVSVSYDHQATLNLMLSLHPDCRRILVLLDDAFASNDAAEELDKALIPFRQRLTVEVWPVGDATNLPAKLVGLDPQDLIYLLIGALPKNGGHEDIHDMVPLVIRWSPVAIYSCLDYPFGKGIVGGMITSGFNQGEHAARLALRELSAESVKNSAAISINTNRYMFDGRVLRRFKINESLLPAGSEIIHPPSMTWGRHGWVLLAVAIGMTLMSGYLLFRLFHQKKKQQTLTQTNVELNGRFREKSVHLKLINQKLKKQALIDGLTGLPNRRYVYQRFVEEAKKAQRYAQPLAILLISVDGFKNIHDNHGYMVAERVLRDVGHSIKRNIREIDLVGRYGGESFLVVLPCTDQGRCAADRIRKTVLSLQWEQGEQKVTVSGGLAQLDGHSPAELIAVAEKRLDLAKSQGGDRIVVAETNDVKGIAHL